ncbi:DNA-directed RNA polymerase III subunit C31 [Lecanora helva]
MPRRAPPRGGPQSKRDDQGNSLYRIGGVDVPYDPDSIPNKPKPTPLFPEYHPKKPAPLTEDEKRTIKNYKTLREKIHDGPHFTVLPENVRTAKPGQKPDTAAAAFDPFDGMPKYSDRYQRKKKLRNHTLGTAAIPMDKQFLPEELWPALDPGFDRASLDAEWAEYKSRNIKIPGIHTTLPDDFNPADANDNLKMESGDEGEGEGQKKRKTAARDPDDEDPLEGEDVDDDYDDEDEGGGDDYNAEQYFDGGGDDLGEDFDGGGDEGGGEWY